MLHDHIGAPGEIASTEGPIHDPCANAGKLPVTILLSGDILSESKYTKRLFDLPTFSLISTVYLNI